MTLESMAARVGGLVCATLMVCSISVASADEAGGAEAGLTQLRSVTAGIEVVEGVPRLVLLAQGVVRSARGMKREIRYVVDPSRCGLHPIPFRQDLSSTPARELRWYHIVWRDSGVERVIGSALGIRDEMPGPGRRERYEVLSLPRADYGYDPDANRFRFEPELTRAPRRPDFIGATGLRGRCVWLSELLPVAERASIAGVVARAGGRLVEYCGGPVEIVVLPVEVDFVDVRDAQAEASTDRGARVIYATELLK